MTERDSFIPLWERSALNQEMWSSIELFTLYHKFFMFSKASPGASYAVKSFSSNLINSLNVLKSILVLFAALALASRLLSHCSLQVAASPLVIKDSTNTTFFSLLSYITQLACKCILQVIKIFFRSPCFPEKGVGTPILASLAVEMVPSVIVVSAILLL